MRSCRRRSIPLVLALFVAFVVIALPLAERDRAPSPLAGSARQDTAARDASPPPVASAATTPLRRLISLDVSADRIAGATQVALALLCWIAVGASAWALSLCAGLTRRSRAPPFVLA